MKIDRNRHNEFPDAETMKNSIQHQETFPLCNADSHRFSRRALLASGGSASILASISKAIANEEDNGSKNKPAAKNVILLWLEGGPSQLETFDPHPGGLFGGDTKAITTPVLSLIHI